MNIGKSEILNSKSQKNPKLENKNQECRVSDFAFWISSFFDISFFGFRALLVSGQTQ